MKEVLLFKLTYCPHCMMALRFQEELLAEHPEWRDIPVRVIDEAQEAALADTYDYYYVPTYYVGGERSTRATPRSPTWSGSSALRRRINSVLDHREGSGPKRTGALLFPYLEVCFDSTSEFIE